MYICVLPGLKPVVVHSSCPFLGRECELPSNGGCSAPWQPAGMSQTRSFNQALLPAPPSLHQCDSDCPLTTGLNADHISGTQLWSPFRPQHDPLLLTSLFYLPVHLFSLSQQSLLVPAALLVPTNRAATRYVFNGSSGTGPVGLLSVERVVIWWFG